MLYRNLIAILLCLLSELPKVCAQEVSVVGFFSESPVVSEYVVDIEAHRSARVETTELGWKLFAGQTVRITIPYPPPNHAISEIRLGYDWSGGVISGVFQAFGGYGFKRKIIDEVLLPVEKQKRIYPDMRGREFEFRIFANFHPKNENNYLLLQTISIFWEPIQRKGSSDDK